MPHRGAQLPHDIRTIHHSLSHSKYSINLPNTRTGRIPPNPHSLGRTPVQVLPLAAVAPVRRSANTADALGVGASSEEAPIAVVTGAFRPAHRPRDRSVGARGARGGTGGVSHGPSAQHRARKSVKRLLFPFGTEARTRASPCLVGDFRLAAYTEEGQCSLLEGARRTIDGEAGGRCARPGASSDYLENGGYLSRERTSWKGPGEGPFGGELPRALRGALRRVTARPRHQCARDPPAEKAALASCEEVDFPRRFLE
ncbi:hypothetical protein KM043_008265 [Ampulex compressa]|nr:hypothetical protein KM043_008265 [Ampulex compressa]